MYKLAPMSQTGLLPTRSATEPKIKRVQPAARAYTEAGHSSKLSLRPTSAAIAGSAVVRRPG